MGSIYAIRNKNKYYVGQDEVNSPVNSRLSDHYKKLEAGTAEEKSGQMQIDYNIDKRSFEYAILETSISKFRLSAAVLKVFIVKKVDIIQVILQAYLP